MRVKAWESALACALLCSLISACSVGSQSSAPEPSEAPIAEEPPKPFVDCTDADFAAANAGLVATANDADQCVVNGSAKQVVVTTCQKEVASGNAHASGRVTWKDTFTERDYELTAVGIFGPSGLPVESKVVTANAALMDACKFKGFLDSVGKSNSQ